MLNALIGIGLGRFGSIWATIVFIPIVVAEVCYGIYVHHLSTSACLRRSVVLLVCAQFAFMLGALMRPLRGET